jgi:hypothetical protein
MWYLEGLIFSVSMLSLSSLLLPWSILTEEHDISSDCKLENGFQLRLWGSACGCTWHEWQTQHESAYYFAFVHVVDRVRVMTLIVAILAAVQYLFSVVKQSTREKGVLLMSLLISVISIVSLSMYINEMMTMMTIPVSKLFVQGPGYLALMLCAAVSGSVFFLQFFMIYYGLGERIWLCTRTSCDKCIACASYLVAVCCVVVAFGDSMTVETCKDVSTPISSCLTNEHSTWLMIVVLSNVVFSVLLCFLLKFYPENSIAVYSMCFVTFSLLAASSGLMITTSGFTRLVFGGYFAFVGCTITVFLALVYNGIIRRIVCGDEN